MGNPNTGEIYELADGEDPKPGDVRLTAEQAARLSELSADVRKLELQSMQTEIKAKELPRYKCHKEVDALRIKAILNPNEGIEQEDDGERILTFSDPGYEACAFLVTADYMRKHKPQVGGYWVRYKDGYQSWSPAEALEDGYTRIQ